MTPGIIANTSIIAQVAFDAPHVVVSEAVKNSHAHCNFQGDLKWPTASSSTGVTFPPR
ncbi:hypothetical protein HOE425_330035 [Hoeflea sp. EC-HK425]|nr:hypothetical protein HOE425_330035 [Hoeflea sp. EC-HK425]